MSKPGTSIYPGRVRKLPVYWPYDIRHIDGVILTQALMRNVRTCRSDAKGKPQAGVPARGKVPMRFTGAELLVVLMKPL